MYTGHESKIMLNSGKPSSKSSQLERQMNRQVVYVFLMQVLICTVCAGYYSA